MKQQPNHLKDGLTQLIPPKKSHFDALFAVASDKSIWSQHPNPLRFQLDQFSNFFEGAMQSKSAFFIEDVQSNSCIGSTRFYNWDTKKKSIYIGYTFISKEYWGKGYNKSIKTQMMRYAFSFVDTVYFQIGASNYRSQKSIVKIGAIKIAEEKIPYYKEEPKLNYLYSVKKEQFYSNN